MPRDAVRHLPPLRVFLPPGSASGDTHRVPLPQWGAHLSLKLAYSVPHARFSREDDDLSTTVWLASWHNNKWWRRLVHPRARAVRVRSISGRWHTVSTGNARVAPGERRTLPGLGMPRRSQSRSAGSPFTCAEHGDLHVTLRLRSLRESSLRCAMATSAALGGVALLRRLPWGRLFRRRVRKLVMSRWTGPGPGISEPFRVWGRPGFYKYKWE